MHLREESAKSGQDNALGELVLCQVAWNSPFDAWLTS